MTTELCEMKLPELEAIIDRGLASFIEVGNALIEIRDAKMYGKGYDTFEEYCDKRFGFTRQRAYQLIDATKTVREMSTRVGADELPTSEMQARVLNSVADTPARRARVLKKAAKDAPKDVNGHPKLTTAGIKKAAGIDPEQARNAAIMKSHGISDPTPEDDGPDRSERRATPPAKHDNGSLGLFNATDQRAWRESYGVLHRLAAKALKADFKKFSKVDAALGEFFKLWTANNPGKWS